MDIAPCPFCGGVAREGHGKNPDATYFLHIMCVKCKVIMKGNDRADLIARWNRWVE